MLTLHPSNDEPLKRVLIRDLSSISNLGSTSSDESIDVLRQKMLTVGEWLLAELAREDGLSERGFEQPNGVALFKEWQKSLRLLRTLAGDYVTATAHYRRAMARTIRVQQKQHR